MIRSFAVAGILFGFVYCAQASDGPGGITSEQARAEMRAKGWPVVTRRVPPKYPKKLARGSVAGCTVVAFDITPKGKPDNFQVVNSVPPGAFDQAVLAALYTWEYEPQERTVRGLQSISFGFKGTKHGSRVNQPPPPMCDLPLVHQSALQAETGGIALQKIVAPYYPPEAVKTHTEACTAVTFDILPSGLADNFQTHGKEPDQFEKAAVWALVGSRFSAVKKPVRAVAVYRFDLKASPDEPHSTCAVPPGFNEPVEKPKATT